MQMPKSKYEQTKICDEPRVKEMRSTQDIFSIESIDESSVFELPGKKFSKLYALTDINFAGVTDEEQKNIIINFSKVLKTIPCRFSYAVANEYVDERQFHEKILYQYHKNKYDGLTRSYNTVISDKVKDAKQGLYQTIYLMFNFVDNADSGTGLIRMGNVTVPFDMRMSKESKIYKIVNTDGGGYGV